MGVEDQETPSVKIKNIVFDIGGVLLEVDFERFLRDEFFVPAKEAEIIADKTFRSQDWERFDRGIISKEEAADIFALRLPDYSEMLHEVMEKWEDSFKPIQPNVDLLKFFRREDSGYQVYALSNFPSESFTEARKRFAFLYEFTGEIISGSVGYLKPEPQIYQLLLSEFLLQPEETIFIDDVWKNIQGAAREGISGIHYQNPTQLKRELNEHGVDISGFLKERS
ncbi:MAG: HAD family hydrolase [Bacillota bacterium]